MKKTKSETVGTPVSPPRELTLTRTFNAPRERVFKAFTDAKAFAAWWMPHGFTNPSVKLDARPGGTIDVVSRGPAGSPFDMDMPMGGQFVEVDAPQRLVFTTVAFPSKNGKNGIESICTITLSEKLGKTTLNLHVKVTEFDPQFAGALAGMRVGWAQSFEKLDALFTDAPVSGPGVPEFTISRVFNAPRSKVWDAWTNPAALEQWFGPKGVTMQDVRMDLRPGGLLHYSMNGPDGKKMWGKWIFRTIEPNRKLTLISAFSDEMAGTTRHPLAPTWPEYMYSEFELDDASAGKTNVTIRWMPLNPSPAELKTFKDGMSSMNAGWAGTFEQLENYLAVKTKGSASTSTSSRSTPSTPSATDTSDRDVTISRVVHAKPERVWKALTDPKQVGQWWGPNGFTNTLTRMDVKPGGVWESVMHGPDGTDYPNYAKYLEVVPNERLVYQHGSTKDDVESDTAFRQTITIQAQGNYTLVTLHLVFASKAIRDMTVKKANAIEGGNQTLARLDAFVSKR